MERWRKGGREEGRKGGREEGRKGGREEGRKGGREEGQRSKVKCQMSRVKVKGHIAPLADRVLIGCCG